MDTAVPGLSPAPDAPYPLVVVGSGPAGVSAARAYLDAGGPGPVLMLTSDAHPPYERPPLSKDVLRGAAPTEGRPIGGEPLPAGVELRTGATAARLDLTERTLWAGGEPVRFDRLVLAPGADPVPLPGVEDGAEVHVLRSLAHAQDLVRAARRARTAVVVGSGFIGCEAAASLARRGIAVTLVTPDETPQAARLGAEAGARLAQWLVGAGVEPRAGVRVTGVEAPRTVHLSDGTTLAPDLVLAAIGVEPAGAPFEDPEITLHEGRIVADGHLRAAPGVWVAGDAARAHHAVAGRPIPVEHWGDALAMGEIAGHNAAADATGGEPRAWDGVPGFWSTIGDRTLKQAAWGDGFATAHLVDHGAGFTVWHADDAGRVVGVLTHDADEDYERGQELIAAGAPVAEALG